MLLALVAIALPCDWLIYDDYSDGSADGQVYGGTFVTGGWRADGGTIVYDLPDVVSGTITMRLSNVDESGVSQHDLLELFSGDDGSFSDSRRDNFLQVKFAGDIYDGYDGRVKLQAGPEFYGEVEVGAWTSEYDWQAGSEYDFSISWGGTTASMGIASVLSTSIDYSVYGELSFRTLRVPNDTAYARDGLMDDVVYAGVSLCGVSGTYHSPDDEDDGGEDTGSGGDTGTGTDTGSGTGTDTGSGTDTDGGDNSGTTDDTDQTVAPPVVNSFEVLPREVASGETWEVSWVSSGTVSRAQFCVAGTGRFENCTSVDPLSSSASMSTDGLVPGDFRGRVVLEGPGGEGTSGELLLTVTPAVGPTGVCSAVGAPGAGLGVVLAALMAGRRRYRSSGGSPAA